LTGNIINTGGPYCDQRKFAYKEKGTDTWVDVGYEQGMFGKGLFDFDLAELKPNRTYEFKAMAHNSKGWSEGYALTFSTLAGGISNKGDVNGDGKITVEDIIKTINIALYKDNPTGVELASADVNGDGQVTVRDVVQIVNIVLESERGAL